MGTEQPQRKQIHTRINQSTKDGWEDFIEESNSVSSMSELVRHGVTTFIADERSDNQPQQGSPVGENYGPEIIDTLQGLQAEVESLSDRMNSVERESGRSMEETGLATRIYHLLPTEKPHTENWNHRKAGDESLSTVWSGTVEELTEHLFGLAYDPMHEEKIESALNRLMADTAIIKTEEIKGEQRFWRTD